MRPTFAANNQKVIQRNPMATVPSQSLAETSDATPSLDTASISTREVSTPSTQIVALDSPFSRSNLHSTNESVLLPGRLEINVIEAAEVLRSADIDIIPVIDLLNIIVRVPPESVLRNRLKTVIRDSYGREKAVPQFLKHADKEFRLGRLLLELNNTSQDSFKGLPPTAMITMEMVGTFKTSIALASCFLESTNYLAASRLLSLKASHFGTSSFGNSAEAARFVGLTRDNDPKIRAEGYEHLERVGPVYPEAIPTLITGQADNKAEMAFFSCEQALSDFGLRALPELTEALNRDDPLIRGQSANIIGKLGRAAFNSTATLLTRLEHENDDWVKSRLASTLCDIGGDSVAAHPGGLKLIYSYLLDAIARQDVQNVRSCLSIISTSGEAGKIFIPKLLDLLTKHDPETSKPYAYDIGGWMSFKICHTLADLVSDQVTEHASCIMLSPKPQDARFTIEIGRHTWHTGPSIYLNTENTRWGMS